MVNKPPAGRSLNLHQLLGMVEMENSSALVVMTNLETENMIVISPKLVFLRPTLSTSYKNTIKCNLMTLFYDCESRLWNSSIKSCRTLNIDIVQTAGVELGYITRTWFGKNIQ